MFGNNTPVSKQAFKDMPINSLGIVSRFYTLQGEGPYSGEPAVFVRLAKCNLTCTFCDTYFDSMTVYTFEDLYAELLNCITTWQKENNAIQNNRWISKNVGLVITGGEPMLQENIKEFLEFTKNKFSWSQIESNGTIFSPIPQDTTLVCSPKAPKNKYIKPNNQYLSRADCLKFVVTANAQSPYNTIPQWAIDWAEETSKTIYISPMNVYKKEPEQSKILRMKESNPNIDLRSNVDEVISFWEDGLLDTKANEKNHAHAALLCMQYGFKLNLQTHLFAALP